MSRSVRDKPQPIRPVRFVCTGAHNCPAPQHVEGCFSGDTQAAPLSAVGDAAGYLVMVQDRFNPDRWNDTGGGRIATIGAAVGLVGAYERTQYGAAHRDTYAVAKLSLVMISHPGPPPSCPNRWMDGRNEVRCWAGTAGHDGPCK